MGIRLNEAAMALRGKFPAQRQGDCGVFSFYYAAHLIQHVHGAKGLTVLSVDPPRKRYHPLAEAVKGPDRVAFTNPTLTPQDRHTMTASIRKFAKDDFQSVQGEIFALAEMQSLINHYGYGSTVSTAADPEAKKAFIAEALRNDHPVLIPYWCDDDGYPCKTDKEPGAHWSVIFDVTADEAHYLNPWWPSKAMEAKSMLFLVSNAAVDEMRYASFYSKGDPAKSVGKKHDIGSKTKGGTYSAVTGQPDPLVHKAMYPGGRKPALQHVLFEVYASPEQLKAMGSKTANEGVK